MTVNIETNPLEELYGLTQAFKTIAFAAANEKQQNYDPIDWDAVAALAERAQMIVMALRNDAKAGAR